MASGTLGDSPDDSNLRWRSRWTENSKVYTRKVRKKAQKTCNNNDTATAAVFTGETPSTADATSGNPTLTRSEVSSATASIVAAEFLTASTSEGPNNSLAASPRPTSHGSLATGSSPCRPMGGDVLQESLVSLVTKDVDSSCQRPRDESTHQERSLLNGSVNRDVDSSLQLPPPPQEHQEQLQEPHMSSLSDDNDSAPNHLQEGSGTQIANLRNIEDLPPAKSNEVENQNRASPHHNSELLRVNEDRLSNFSESSPLSMGNDLQNDREGAAGEMPHQNDIHNDEEAVPGPPQLPTGNDPGNVNGVVEPLVICRVDDRVRFKLFKSTPKIEIEELRKKLGCELDQVRSLAKQLEVKELQLASNIPQISNSDLNNGSNYIGAEGSNVGGYSHPQLQYSQSELVDRRALSRVNSELVAVGHTETRPVLFGRVNSDMSAARNLEPRPYSRQLSVAVMENNHRANELVDKEKRTPKANQYYRNSEFLLGKDRLPPESNKRLKTSNGRKHGGEMEHAFGFGKSMNQVFKSCSSLLQRLMKHKHGWVFNEPVNAKALGLVDYHDIIKHPMDLGTIKTRLSQNWYKSPREFAEDVRLVFRNAMTYNPKGQDVHVMAEQLSQIFEERWVVIESEYNPHWRYPMYQDAGLLTPTSRKAPPHSHFTPASISNPAPANVLIPLYAPAAPQLRTFDRPEPMTPSVSTQRPHVGRTPVPKKPKAKDLNKRDMTYDEKQKLSSRLQGLPPEKLDAIVQIIKKRNTALMQHDDEIEVDIDRVDAETLWELDRFVTNYKKSLSKNKRKAELALEARKLANQNVPLGNLTPAVTEAQIESRTAFETGTAPPPAEGEKQVYNGSRSSSSSSSSSDSGSSSSDSDTDSSSADGSDAGQSPRT